MDWHMFGVIALGTLFAEDLVCITTGLMIAHGTVDWWTGVAACGLGIFAGDFLLYLAGRTWGRSLVRVPPFRWFLSEEKVARAEHWFQRQGPRVILVSRFIPASRLVVYFTAGLLKMDVKKLVLYFLIAISLWVPLILGVSRAVGDHMQTYFETFKTHALVWAGIALVFWWLWSWGVPLFTHRGRRLWLGWYKRVTHWEFWPAGVFYIPVVIKILGLMLRYRSATVFTAANPAIPAGGFVGESKAQILDGLRDEEGLVAGFVLLRASDGVAEQMAQLRSFMERKRLTFPVVLKPDAGQRGSGVTIAHSLEQAQAHLQATQEDTVAQEYVPGREFGVFYYRYPNQAQGQLYAITEKIFPEVTGDGKRTLEELIVDDPRAVAMAQVYLEKQKANVDDVPAAGQKRQLTDIGAHCRGTIFRDGERYKTEALRQTIDALCQRYPGFYFGRFDIRVFDEELWRQGRGFRAIELNGITSEPTNIYDAKYSLWEAYRTMFRLWDILFEIGAQNKARGARVWTVKELWQMHTGYQRLLRRRRQAIPDA